MKSSLFNTVSRVAACAALSGALFVALPAYAADSDDQSMQNDTSAPSTASGMPTPMQNDTSAATTNGMATPSKMASATAGTTMGNKGVQSRIKHLHDQLKITSDEETLWSKVAQVMANNANAMDTAMKDRATNSSTMNAVDDIKSYQAMTAAHAQGLSNFADAFGQLYAAMPPAQQENADKVFGHIKHSPKVAKSSGSAK